MRVLINGTPQDILHGTRLDTLLAQLKIAPDRVAIELNLTLVDRKAFNTPLNEGDKIEIINFVGGGCHGHRQGHGCHGHRRGHGSRWSP